MEGESGRLRVAAEEKGRIHHGDTEARSMQRRNRRTNQLFIGMIVIDHSDKQLRYLV